MRLYGCEQFLQVIPENCEALTGLKFSWLLCKLKTGLLSIAYNKPVSALHRVTYIFARFCLILHRVLMLADTILAANFAFFLAAIALAGGPR